MQGSVEVSSPTRRRVMNPAKVYKHAHDCILRAFDIRGLGDGHELQDNPMMIEGNVRVLEEGNQRVKVSGQARAEAGGSAHYVRGWIEKDGVT